MQEQSPPRFAQADLLTPEQIKEIEATFTRWSRGNASEVFVYSDVNSSGQAIVRISGWIVPAHPSEALK